MAGMFVKFALFLIISCALLVRVAEAVPGDENTNNEDFHGSSRGDKPFFISFVMNFNFILRLVDINDFNFV